jgi:hypothetical protein
MIAAFARLDARGRGILDDVIQVAEPKQIHERLGLQVVQVVVVQHHPVGGCVVVGVVGPALVVERSVELAFEQTVPDCRMR